MSPNAAWARDPTRRQNGKKVTPGELDVVEGRQRSRRQTAAMEPAATPEAAAFAAAGVAVAESQDFLRRNDLVLIVSRDVPHRDSFDKNQPFNLKVSGSTVKNRLSGSNPLTIEEDHLPLFAAEQMRGVGLGNGAGLPPSRQSLPA